MGEIFYMVPKKVIDISKHVNNLHQTKGYPIKSITRLCTTLANDGIEPDYDTVKKLFDEAVYSKASLTVLIVAYRLAKEDLDQVESYVDSFIDLNDRLVNLTAIYLSQTNTK